MFSKGLVLCLFLATVSFAAQTVEGHVVNAVTGAPVAGVRVRIWAAGETPANGHITTTDSQGRFRIDGLDPGAYLARYGGTGFLPIPASGAVPTPFVVGSGSAPLRLEIAMQPMGKLSGRVLDATGKRVSNAGIWLVAQDKWCMPPACSPAHRQAKSDEKGEFSFNELAPGPWLVSATAPRNWKPPDSRGDERLGWAQTYFPGVIDPQLAEAVMVRPGDEQWNADIKLESAPVHRVRGRLLNAGGDPVNEVLVSLRKGFGPSIDQETKSDGTFELEGVVDDEWRLSAEVEQDRVKLRAAQMVEVKKHDLEGIEVRLSAPFTLRGKLVMEVPEGATAPEAPDIDAGLVPVTGLITDGPDGFLVAREDGSGLTVRDVYAGPYQVQFLSDSPAPYFLDSIRLGDQNAAGTISILSDATPLNITFKLGGGTVRGTIEGCGSKHVFLVPQEPALRRNGFIRIATCDRNGHFEFPAVRPGEYYGIAPAIEPRSFAGLGDEGLLKQAGQVTVRANESTSADIRVR
jgi:uncharacterized GH25 family protein